jgi:hypothetical protein
LDDAKTLGQENSPELCQKPKTEKKMLSFPNPNI